jgi:hypothetical protein
MKRKTFSASAAPDLNLGSVETRQSPKIEELRRRLVGVPVTICF